MGRAMTAAIEVLAVRAVDRGNLKAFAKVRLGAVVIHGVKVVQQPNQRPWLRYRKCRAVRRRMAPAPAGFP
jgi:hypothetical protein